MAVEIGKKIKSVEVPGTQGSFKLSDYKGQRVVLYFYPKDMTSGCTTEGNDFSANIAKFKALNTVVFGVSKDSIKSHLKFIEKEDFRFELLSDEAGVLCDQFEVFKEKSMYGRKYMGIERSTFLIDESGNLIQEWRKVKVPGHVASVLTAIKEI